jgi:arsenical-resistance protein 2
MQVMVLEGGVKGWVKSGPQYIQYMDGFDEKHWVQLFEAEQEAKEGTGKSDVTNSAVAAAVGEGDVKP